jgi:hypothetical protein
LTAFAAVLFTLFAGYWNRLGWRCWRVSGEERSSARHETNRVVNGLGDQWIEEGT